MTDLMWTLLIAYLFVGALFSIAVYLFSNINGIPLDFKDWLTVLAWTPGWLPFLVYFAGGFLFIILTPMDWQNKLGIGLGRRFC